MLQREKMCTMHRLVRGHIILQCCQRDGDHSNLNVISPLISMMYSLVTSQPVLW